MSNQLSGRIAIVTGGTQGLGRGIVKAFIGEGATVVNFDIKRPPQAEDEVGWLDVDVADTYAVKNAVDRVIETFGRVDILANNAGVAPADARPLVDNSDEEIARVLAINVGGVINCARAVIPHMRAQGGGRIINTASQLGKYAKANWAVYSATKFAVVGLTQALALEHAADRIAVNAICPGTFRTPMVESIFGKFAEQSGQDTDSFIQNYADNEIAFGRMGTPQDMGNLAVFLASDKCSFTTGASLNLSGGEATFF